MLSSSTNEDSGNAITIRTRLVLVFDDGRIYILLVPLPREQFFPVLVDRRGHDTLYDVRVVADGRRRELIPVVFPAPS